MTAPTDAQATIAEYDSALHTVLDENEALRAERDQLRTEIDRLVSWIMATTTRCTACNPSTTMSAPPRVAASRLRLRPSATKGRS